MIDDLPYYTLRRRLIKLEEAVAAEWPWAIKQDLKKLLKNAQTAVNDLNKEIVNCRRTHKLTSHYYYLEEAADTIITAVEKRITWARLL